MKRAFATIAIGLVLSGCGALTHTAAPTSGRVAGHVTVRACGGANTENQTGCQAHPSPGVTLAFKQVAGGDISFATTDAGGAYAITLPPGDYLVSPRDASSLGPMRRWGGPNVVTVRAGKTMTADFVYTIQLL